MGRMARRVSRGPVVIGPQKRGLPVGFPMQGIDRCGNDADGS